MYCTLHGGPYLHELYPFLHPRARVGTECSCFDVFPFFFFFTVDPLLTLLFSFPFAYVCPYQKISSFCFTEFRSSFLLPFAFGRYLPVHYGFFPFSLIGFFFCLNYHSVVFPLFFIFIFLLCVLGWEQLSLYFFFPFFFSSERERKRA